MGFRHALVLGLVLGLAGLGTAQAQDMSTGADGWYLRAEGGWNHLDNSTVTATGTAGTASTTFHEGFIVGGAVGYHFNPFRVEGEFDYRSNNLKSVTAPFAGTTGNANAVTGLVNGYYDIPWQPVPGLVPYVGLGVGLADIGLNAKTSGGAPAVGDHDVVFAVQPSIGLRYVTSPSTSFGLEYRFLNGFSPSFRTQGGGTASTGDYQSHSVLISFTYQFGAPPPPPAAAAAAVESAPAPAPTRRVFLVFFDFDKSLITDAGRQVVAAAAAAYKGGNGAKIQASGYTDLSGTASYNMALSERRADAVRDLLIADGVPRDAIDLAWHGKENPRVPTPNGVREPQNRRVEVVIP